jgi:hypothetical protein
MDSWRVQQLGDAAGQFAFKLQQTVEDPGRDSRNIPGKAAYTLSMLLRLAVILAGLGLVVDFLAERWFGRQIPWSAIVESVVSVGWFQVTVLLVAVVIVRRILMRVSQPDAPQERRERVENMEGLNCREPSLPTATSLPNMGSARRNRSVTIEPLLAPECDRPPLLELTAQ